MKLHISMMKLHISMMKLHISMMKFGSGHIPVFGLWISVQTESVCVADLSKIGILIFLPFVSIYTVSFVFTHPYQTIDRCMKYLLNTNYCNCNHETFIKHESL